MHLFDAADTQQLLPYGPLVRALDAMLDQLRAGKARAPVRTSIPLSNDGVLLLMPATDGAFASLKTATVHMGNASKGLPSIHGAVLLMNAGTGQHLAVFDGPTLTAKRTAAVSLLGAIKLKGQPKGQLLIVGAGVQAAAHARAFWSEGKLEKLYMSALKSEAATRLVEQLNEEGIPVQWVSNPAEVIADVQTIITATTSKTPVFSDAVQPNALIIGVGAFQPDMVEIPNTLVQRSRLFADTHAGAKEEAGDYLQAGVNWDEVTPLEGIQAMPHPDGRPMVFKSVGHSLWDLAAAELAYTNQRP
ncbi:MAG: hypothetical protein A3F78_02065 [Burkholderiales bacterium RIFCSPLOWO2_12_FULL_61_40]|nr:MAG: hypothetical protein A3F78_02065 [Burkholderiales bacterium RIFCSPLOWO2_12_FULL_61_40]